MSNFFIHSLESCGTVDGPGIRYVVFLQGCPLKCLYCHNPDTWNMQEGKVKTVEEIFAEVRKYKSYFEASNGGLTVTGGEPLLQQESLIELFTLCKENGFHTTIDTSGYVPIKDERLWELTDLFLLDIKSSEPEVYQKLTGKDLQPTLNFLKEAVEHNKKLWIRHVLVPGITLGKEKTEQLISLILPYKENIERIEVLPFHKMGEYKWEVLKREYQLTNTQEPTEEETEMTRQLFKDAGFLTY